MGTKSHYPVTRVRQCRSVLRGSQAQEADVFREPTEEELQLDHAVARLSQTLLEDAAARPEGEFCYKCGTACTVCVSEGSREYFTCPSKSCDVGFVRWQYVGNQGSDSESLA